MLLTVVCLLLACTDEGTWTFDRQGVYGPTWFHNKHGKTHKIEADSYDQLEKTVLRFRLEQIVLVDAARADPEHVSEDIKGYICANFPNSCVDRSGGTTAAVSVDAASGSVVDSQFSDQTFRMHMPLIQRIAEWFGTLSVNPPSFTTPAVADKRANTDSGKVRS